MTDKYAALKAATIAVIAARAKKGCMDFGILGDYVNSAGAVLELLAELDALTTSAKLLVSSSQALGLEYDKLVAEREAHNAISVAAQALPEPVLYGFRYHTGGAMAVVDACYLTEAAALDAWGNFVPDTGEVVGLCLADGALSKVWQSEPVGIVGCDDYSTHPNTGTSALLSSPLPSGTKLYTTPQSAAAQPVNLALDALKICRDRFFPANQPEENRDQQWEQVNAAVAQLETK